ncbi:MAG: PIN-like domain-containing protein [Methylorubrum populi]
MDDDRKAPDAPRPPAAASAESEVRGRGKAAPKPPSGDYDHFLLGRLYPEAHNVFQPAAALDPTSGDVLIALDTNALLLPYQMGKGDLADLAGVYSRIAGEGRLFIPEQVAREFIKNRDRKLADMVHALDERISKMTGWDAQVSPLLLEGFADGDALDKAAAGHREAAKAYLEQLRRLTGHMKGWRGDDPVTRLYAGVFGSGQTVAPAESNEQVIEELEYGIRHRVPPGYKDAAKEDQGIGDVLIWLSLLHLGRTQRKDLIFVTGEEKADWFVRSGGKRLYPRPELVDAYRRVSGRSLRLSSLHDLLKEMAAPAGLVADVADAEATANSAIQAAAVSAPASFATTAHATVRPAPVRFAGGGTAMPTGRRSFDYSTHNGMLRVEAGGQAVDIAFSKASDTSIHLYRRGATRRIARVKGLETGMFTSIDAVDTTSDHYVIQLGEGFLVENEAGSVLACRIVGILDDTRGAERDEVTFEWVLNPAGDRVYMP